MAEKKIHQETHVIFGATHFLPVISSDDVLLSM